MTDKPIAGIGIAKGCLAICVDGGARVERIANRADAVISALLLKVLWRPYCGGALSGATLETAAFAIFLYARMFGCAARLTTI